MGEPLRKVLVASLHFPPDTGAASHRYRLLAPRLPAHGWEPVVVAVDPARLGVRTEPGLSALVHGPVRVVHAGALPAGFCRALGFGDLGLRAWFHLRRTCARLLDAERFEAAVVTMPPHPAGALGPWIRARSGVPFVLDYQDPWVGEWGRSVGGGPGGSPDLRSRLSRRLGEFLEPRAVAAASGLAAVSSGTVEGHLARIPAARALPFEEIPLGGDPADFAAAARVPGLLPPFDPADGNLHLVYAGTLLPLGMETLRALLGAAGLVSGARPDLGRRLRLHFYGTSNRTDPGAAPRVLPEAERLGVASMVEEVPERIDYARAVAALSSAAGILLLGSSEPHYTASKIYPALLARRPVLGLFHEASTSVAALRAAGRPPTVRVVTYGEAERAEGRTAEIARALEALLAAPEFRAEDVDGEALAAFGADRLAGRLARLLDRIARGAP